ncbi:MAG: hypothetical protein JOZ82_13855 [Marmoricola sp.]|nr:hypothetical protein [Marmoricola sp.]
MNRTPGGGEPPHDEGDGSAGGPGDPGPAGEPVGSLGEEAAKLLGALSDWARDQGHDYAGTASGAAGAFSHAVHEVDEHIATGSADCRYCPVCQVIHVVRSTSPEVRTHLAMAAGSLMNAAAGLLATQTEQRTRPSGVEKIDLDDGSPWDEEP